jgi:hypothetical protein
MQDMLADFMRTEQADKHMTMGFWMPYEYFEAANQNKSDMAAAGLLPVKRLLQRYMLVVVVDCQMGDFGGLTPTPEPQVRAETTLIDSHGDKHVPLAPETLDADVQGLINVMRPMLAGMLGQLGRNMQIFVFDATMQNGDPIADPLQPGRFTLAVGEHHLAWRLPCGSLLPRKACATCGESFSGAFLYCPYDGHSLPDVADAPKQ